MDYEEAKAYALKRLSLGGTTTARLRQQLQRREVSVEDIATLIDLLTKSGFLSDDDYSAAFIRQERSRGYGPHVILAKLIERGITAAAARELVASAYPDGLQEEILADLLAKERYAALPRSKLIAKLQRRGFFEY